MDLKSLAIGFRQMAHFGDNSADIPQKTQETQPSDKGFDKTQ